MYTGDAPRLPEQQRRYDHNQHRQSDDCRRVVAGEHIHEPLRGRFLFLRFFDKVNDLRQCGVGCQLGDAHFERAAFVERTGKHFAAGILLDRH